jgi:hypothetical protein
LRLLQFDRQTCDRGFIKHTPYRKFQLENLPDAVNHLQYHKECPPSSKKILIDSHLFHYQQLPPNIGQLLRGVVSGCPRLELIEKPESLLSEGRRKRCLVHLHSSHFKHLTGQLDAKSGSEGKVYREIGQLPPPEPLNLTYFHLFVRLPFARPGGDGSEKCKLLRFLGNRNRNAECGPSLRES